jgi:hypothetical protein
MRRAWLTVALLAVVAAIAMTVNATVNPSLGVIYLSTSPLSIQIAPEGAFGPRGPFIPPAQSGRGQGPGPGGGPGGQGGGIPPGMRDGGVRPIAPTAPSTVDQTSVRTRVLRPVGLERTGAAAFVGPLLTLFLVVVISVIAVALFPGRFARVRDAVTVNRVAPLIHLLAGLATLLLLSIMGVALAVVVVGLPLQLLVIGVTATLVVAGLAAAVLLVGGFIRRLGRWSQPSAVLEIVSGALVLFVIGFIPIVGWVVVGASAMIGLGSIVVTRFGSVQGWSFGALERTGRPA